MCHGDSMPARHLASQHHVLRSKILATYRWFSLRWGMAIGGGVHGLYSGNLVVDDPCECTPKTGKWTEGCAAFHVLSMFSRLVAAQYGRRRTAPNAVAGVWRSDAMRAPSVSSTNREAVFQTLFGSVYSNNACFTYIQRHL